MPRDQTNSPLPWDALLDHLPTVTGPVHVRLTEGIRHAIRSGRLPAGAALPPSRSLAEMLGCSRWVVTEAYGQLVAEGYLDARPGSATRVAAARAVEVASPDPLSSATRRVVLDLSAGIPDVRAFPRSRWVEAVRVALAT